MELRRPLVILLLAASFSTAADEPPRVLTVDGFLLAPRILNGRQHATEYDMDLHGTIADMRDDFGLGRRTLMGLLEARLRITADDAVAASVWLGRLGSSGTFGRDIVFNERIWPAGQRFGASFNWSGGAVQYERRLLGAESGVGFSLVAGAGVQYDDAYTIIHIQDPVLDGTSKGEGGRAVAPRLLARGELRLPHGFSASFELAQTVPLKLLWDSKGCVTAGTLQIRWAPCRWFEFGLGWRFSRTDLHLSGKEDDDDEADNRVTFVQEAPFVVVSVRF